MLTCSYSIHCSKTLQNCGQQGDQNIGFDRDQNSWQNAMTNNKLLEGKHITRKVVNNVSRFAELHKDATFVLSQELSRKN